MGGTEERRVGREFAAVEPTVPELLRAFFVYAGQAKDGNGVIGIPPGSISEAVRLAAEKAPFLDKLLAPDGSFTPEAEEEFTRLRVSNVVVIVTGRLRLSENPETKSKETSSVRMIFNDNGTQLLKQATEYAIGKMDTYPPR